MSMEVIIIHQNKKDFLDLLLLADEQEDMIDRYLERGTLFALYDGDLKSTCVVTHESCDAQGDDTYAVQSLATYPQYQRMGYGRYLVNYVCEYYGGKGRTMLVGTGDVPSSTSFYERSGFVFSHRVENYIVEHYDKPIFEDGVQLKDKVYLKRSLDTQAAGRGT